MFGQPGDGLSLQARGWWWHSGSLQWLQVLAGAPAAPSPSPCLWGRTSLCCGAPAAFPWLLEGQGDLLVSNAASAGFWVLAMGL